jgi:hypothetical protein
MVATYDDAGLLVQLMRWGTEMKLEDAFSVIFSEILTARPSRRTTRRWAEFSFSERRSGPW